MLRFRQNWSTIGLSTRALHPASVRELAARILSPKHFWTALGLELHLEHDPEHCQRWEILHGRLLDAAHTRNEATFEEWNLWLAEDTIRGDEPVLSLKFDAAAGQLHIVRSMPCYLWEGYDAGGGVIESRETISWVRELTGTIELGELRDAAELLDELACQVFHAVIGASRLPLSSVEAPLPIFTLGKLAPLFPSTTAMSLVETLSETDNSLERVKRLETLLHATPHADLNALAQSLSSFDVLALLRQLFNEVSLSPWTKLTDKVLELVRALLRQGLTTSNSLADFLAGQILQTTRHLTAYDLITFHHRGANYPDALLLDAFLKELLALLESTPALGRGPEGKLRRRALRQGWLLRRIYENLPVPDAPTSPGENQRVYPPSHIRVPEEQIQNTLKRRRQLYANDPLTLHLGTTAKDILQQSLKELSEERELLELGLALFVDRPLGLDKHPGEPDQTLLLSHRAYSHSLAQRRLQSMKNLFPVSFDEGGCVEALQSLSVAGVPVSAVGGTPRPGSVSVQDARRVAEDFVFLKTSPAIFAELFSCYDFSSVQKDSQWPCAPQLLLPHPERKGVLILYGIDLVPLLELTADASQGTIRRAGRELLRGGLKARFVDQDNVYLLNPRC